jgi:hypothetical protein
MDDEAERLHSLAEACHRVLPRLESGQYRLEEQLEEALRVRCCEVERQLAELEVSFASHSTSY